MATGDLDRLVRRSAEKDRQIVGLDRAERLADVIICALMIEGLGRRPFLPQDGQIFVGPGIAFGLDRLRVAVARHFIIRPAGDDVDSDAAARQLVERSELARRHRWLGEARAVRDKEAEPAG